MTEPPINAYHGLTRRHRERCACDDGLPMMKTTLPLAVCVHYFVHYILHQTYGMHLAHTLSLHTQPSLIHSVCVHSSVLRTFQSSLPLLCPSVNACHQPAEPPQGGGLPSYKYIMLFHLLGVFPHCVNHTRTQPCYYPTLAFNQTPETVAGSWHT